MNSRAATPIITPEAATQIETSAAGILSKNGKMSARNHTAPMSRKESSRIIENRLFMLSTTEPLASTKGSSTGVEVSMASNA